MPRLFFIFIAFIFVASCVPSPRSEDVADVQPFPEEFVPDLIPLKKSRPCRLEDIAFSFPVFEIGAERTKEAIRLGDFRVVSTENSWTLLGDGAQSTVRFDRLSDVHDKELIVRVAFGPVFQAYHNLPDPTFIYEFQRGIGGWKKLNYKREFLPSVIQSGDLTQKNTDQDSGGNGG